MQQDFIEVEQIEYESVSTREPKALTVSEAMSRAKSTLEGLILTIEGEISEISNKPGYKAVYFTIKDDKASLPCMMWMNRFNAAGIDARVGSLVKLTGRFTLYAAKGRMNFDVFSIALAGEGDLRQKVANLAKKLEAEGLMDSSRKRQIPQYAQVIGLVTSPRGAAVHDVLRTLRRRFPLAKVLLAGVPVEGAKAPQELIAGLQCVADAGAEVALLVRGGGSFEDLMPFNDEKLARCISELPIPVVTGIGHEPDTSIADLVADLRASTPTAAAEAVSMQHQEISAAINGKWLAATQKMQRRIERSKLMLEKMSASQMFKDPHALYAADAMHLDAQRAAIESSAAHMIQISRSDIALRASRLHDLSPLAVIARGYALVLSDEGKPITTIEAVSAEDRVSVRLQDGSMDCRVMNTKEVR